jgi:dolichol-phosphate mannosyltransferase
MSPVYAGDWNPYSGGQIEVNIYDGNRLSVVVPAYCEASNLTLLVEKIAASFKNAGIDDYEILIVDDNSPDDTKEICRALSFFYPALKLITRIDERGLATAVRRGVEEATGNIIITMDADLSHDPDLIPELVAGLIENKCDIVVASRYIEKTKVHTSFRRALGSRALNLFVRTLLQIPVKDVTGGFHAMRKDIFNRFDMDYIFRGYGDYSIPLLYEAAKNGLKISETSFVYQFRTSGESKTAVFRTGISYGLRALRIRFGLDGTNNYIHNMPSNTDESILTVRE